MTEICIMAQERVNRLIFSVILVVFKIIYLLFLGEGGGGGIGGNLYQHLRMTITCSSTCVFFFSIKMASCFSLTNLSGYSY